MSNPLSNPDTLNLNPDWQYEDDLVCDYEQYTLQDVLEEFEGVTQRQIEAVVAYGDKREAVGVDRAARLALEVDKDVLYGDDENVRTAVSNAILTLSPDPSYLDRVRNEAATAALEQERGRIVSLIRSRQRWHETNYKADTRPLTTEGRVWTESQRVAAKTLTELIAIIGDDQQDQG